MSEPGSARRGLNWGRIALIAGAVAVLVGIFVGVQALSAPVERAGSPTIAVPSPTGTLSLSPSAGPSATGTASATATGSATSSSTPKSTMKASGDYTWADVTAAAAGSQGTLHRYTVAVETSSKLDADRTAETIAEVLNDPRSWTGDGEVRFALVDKAKADVTVYVASGKSAAALCGSGSESATTCVKGSTVVINAEGWKGGAGTYLGNLARYRTYLVNHAIGHLLGRNHAQCGGAGKKAPVMMQQSVDLDGCNANPWP